MGSCVTKDNDCSEDSTTISNGALAVAGVDMSAASSLSDGVPAVVPCDNAASRSFAFDPTLNSPPSDRSQFVGDDAPTIAVQAPSVRHANGIMSLQLDSSLKAEEGSGLRGEAESNERNRKDAIKKANKSEKRRKKISKPMGFASVLGPTDAPPVRSDGEGLEVWRPGLSPTPSLLALLPNSSAQWHAVGDKKEHDLSVASNSSASPKRGSGRKFVTQGKSFNSSIGSAGSPPHRGSRSNVIFSHKCAPVVDEDPHHAFLEALALQERVNSRGEPASPSSRPMPPNPLATGCTSAVNCLRVANSGESSPADAAEWSMCSLPQAVSGSSHHPTLSPSHQPSTSLLGNSSGPARRSRPQPPLAGSTMQSSFASDFLKDMGQSNVSGSDSQRSASIPLSAPPRVRASGFALSNIFLSHDGSNHPQPQIASSQRSHSGHDPFGDEVVSQMYASHSTDTFSTVPVLPIRTSS